MILFQQLYNIQRALMHHVHIMVVLISFILSLQVLPVSNLTTRVTLCKNLHYQTLIRNYNYSST